MSGIEFKEFFTGFETFIYFLILVGILYLCGVAVDALYNKNLYNKLQAAEKWLRRFDSKDMDKEFRKNHRFSASYSYELAKQKYDNGIPKWVQHLKITVFIFVFLFAGAYFEII
jgi:hypothetical protein